MAINNDGLNIPISVDEDQAVTGLKRVETTIEQLENTTEKVSVKATARAERAAQKQAEAAEKAAQRQAEAAEKAAQKTAAAAEKAAQQQIAAAERAAQRVAAVSAKHEAQQISAIEKGNSIIQKASDNIAAQHQQHADASGQWVSSLGRVTQSFFFVQQAAQMAFAAVEFGIKNTLGILEEYNNGVYQNAAMISSLQKDGGTKEAYDNAKSYTKALNDRFEMIDARSPASAKQLRLMNQELVKQKVFLDPGNDKQMQGFERVANAVWSMSQSAPDKEKQMAQEMRSAAQGQSRGSDQLGMQLESQVGNLKKFVEEHKKANDLVEAMGEKLKGYDYAIADFQKSWEATSSTMKTIYEQIIREGMGGAIEEVSTSMGKMNDFLRENKDIIADKVHKGWLGVKGTIQAINILLTGDGMRKAVYGVGFAVDYIIDGLAMLGTVGLPAMSRVLSGMIDYLVGVGKNILLMGTAFGLYIYSAYEKAVKLANIVKNIFKPIELNKAIIDFKSVSDTEKTIDRIKAKVYETTNAGGKAFGVGLKEGDEIFYKNYAAYQKKAKADKAPYVVPTGNEEDTNKDKEAKAKAAKAAATAAERAAREAEHNAEQRIQEHTKYVYAENVSRQKSLEARLKNEMAAIDDAHKSNKMSDKTYMEEKKSIEQQVLTNKMSMIKAEIVEEQSAMGKLLLIKHKDKNETIKIKADNELKIKNLNEQYSLLEIQKVGQDEKYKRDQDNQTTKEKLENIKLLNKWKAIDEKNKEDAIIQKEKLNAQILQNQGINGVPNFAEEARTMAKQIHEYAGTAKTDEEYAIKEAEVENVYNQGANSKIKEKGRSMGNESTIPGGLFDWTEKQNAEMTQIALEEQMWQESYAKRQGTEQQHAEWRENLTKAFAIKRKNLEQANNEQVVANLNNGMNNIASISSSIMTMMGNKSKKMFAVNKGISIATAMMNTYEGATKAYGQGGVYGFIGAAAVIAAGLANIATISRQKIDENGGGSGGSSGGDTPAVPISSITALPSQPSGGVGGNQGQTFNITIQGNVLSEGDFVQRIAPIMKNLVGSGTDFGMQMSYA